MTLESEAACPNTRIVTKNETVSIPAALSAPLSWSEAAAAGPEICGGKGHNLGRLARYGFRVPRGGVIPASWYVRMLESAPKRAMQMARSASSEAVTDLAVTEAL